MQTNAQHVIMPTEVISLDNKQIRVLFMGTPEIAVSMLERLWSDGYRIIGVVSQPDKKVGRKQVLQMPPVKQAALAHDIPVYQPIRIRDDYEELMQAPHLFARKFDETVDAAVIEKVFNTIMDRQRKGKSYEK